MSEGNWHSSIGMKIGALFGAGLVLAVLLVGGLSVFLSHVDHKKTFEDDAQIATELFSSTLGDAVKFKREDILRESADAFRDRVGGTVDAIDILDVAGNRIGGTNTERSPQELQRLQEMAAQDLKTNLDAHSYAVFNAVRSGPENAVVGTVVISWSEDVLYDAIRYNAGVTAVVLSVAITVFLAISFFMLRHIVIGPISQIERAMKQLACGQIHVNVPCTKRTDELGGMARAAEAFKASILANETHRESQQKAEEASRVAHQKMLEALQAGVGVAVDAALTGQFDEASHARFDDEILDAIGVGVNEICRNNNEFLTELEKTIYALADGDFTYRMAEGQSGRFGELSQKFNSSIRGLSTMVTEVSTVGADLAQTIETVAHGAVDLSKQAESQANSLQETAASMEEMTSLVKLNNGRAAEISRQTKDTQSRAEKGQAVVTGAVTAMEEIETSSSKITEIISVIDGIAFQTNLLSLNAAVEAARAGPAGRGFAVVAAEVRTLAQSSSNAANDIKELIHASQSKVRDGAELVRATGNELDTIIASIKTVSDQIGEVSQATEEQSVGVAEISAVISNLDTATQNYAGHAERSASTSRRMSRRAQDLQQIVSQFNVGELSTEIDAEAKFVREHNDAVAECSSEANDLTEETHSAATAA